MNIDTFEKDYWSSVWENTTMTTNRLINDEFVGIKDSLFLKTILKHSDTNDIILDAGCGMGPFVVHLAERGFKIIGLDYDDKVIDKMKRCFPTHKWYHGDILNIPFGNCHFDRIISSGVIYYFPEGPDNALKESARVLKNEGIMFVSVPYRSYLQRLVKFIVLPRTFLIRTIKFILGKNIKEPFYQPEYSISEFSKILIRNGFITIETHPLGKEIGFFQEINYLIKIRKGKKYFANFKGNEWKGLTKTGKLLCNSFNFISQWFTADMVLFVVKKSQ